MTKIQPTETIKLDENTVLKVSELSDKTRAIVGVYDAYRQKLFDANSEIQMINVAVNAVLNQIQQQVIQHLDQNTKIENEVQTTTAE